MGASYYYRLPLRAAEFDHLYSLEEIALELGITRQRVRQLEAKAIAKLRKGLAAHGYRVTDLIDLGRRLRAEDQP